MTDPREIEAHAEPAEVVRPEVPPLEGCVLLECDSGRRWRAFGLYPDKASAERGKGDTTRPAAIVRITERRPVEEVDIGGLPDGADLTDPDGLLNAALTRAHKAERERALAWSDIRGVHGALMDAGSSVVLPELSYGCQHEDSVRAIIAERDAARAEVERLRALVREVARSSVEHPYIFKNPGYIEATMTMATWDACRAESQRVGGEGEGAECAARKPEAAGETRQSHAPSVIAGSPSESGPGSAPSTPAPVVGPARLGCYGCGIEYGGPAWIETRIPDDVWAKIAPNPEGGGVLCPCCIAKRCNDLGLRNVPMQFVGTEPVVSRAYIDPTPAADDAYARGFEACREAAAKIAADVAASWSEARSAAAGDILDYILALHPDAKGGRP